MMACFQRDEPVSVPYSDLPTHLWEGATKMLKGNRVDAPVIYSQR
jgi:hypothetical protein